MSKLKFLAGLIVVVGLPAVFGLMWFGSAWKFQHQHIHHVWASLEGGKAVRHEESYKHSEGSIIAMYGLFSLFWTFMAVPAIWFGAEMIGYRNVNHHV